MEEKTEGTEQVPKETETKTNDTDTLFASLRQEIAEEEAKAKEANAQKLKELEEKSYSKDEVKEMMKAMLKEQQKTAQESQVTKEEIEAMKNKLDEKSGSQIQTEVEETPFKAPEITETKTKQKQELTDEWVLKQKGLI